MPSNHEGLVLTCIEASLAHTLAIVNWCAGVTETLPEDWPLMVVDNKVDGFIDLFRNKLQSLDYQRLADAAYKYVREHFSLEIMQQEYEKLYRVSIA